MVVIKTRCTAIVGKYSCVCIFVMFVNSCCAVQLSINRHDCVVIGNSCYRPPTHLPCILHAGKLIVHFLKFVNM